ncbi:hypothetical protein V3C99_018749 [Haemonchus contortus]
MTSPISAAIKIASELKGATRQLIKGLPTSQIARSNLPSQSYAAGAAGATQCSVRRYRTHGRLFLASLPQPFNDRTVYAYTFKEKIEEEEEGHDEGDED